MTPTHECARTLAGRPRSVCQLSCECSLFIIRSPISCSLPHTVAEEPGPDVPELSPAVSVQPAGTLPSCARDSSAVAAENLGPDVPAPQPADPGPSVGSPVVDHPTSTTVKSLDAPSFPAPVSAELSGPPCVRISHGMPVLGLVNLGQKKVRHLPAPMSRLFREG